MPTIMGSKSKTEYWSFDRLYNLYKSTASEDLTALGGDFKINHKNEGTFNDYLIKKYHFTEKEFKANPRLAWYKRFFHDNLSIIGNYHRNLYHTLKYVYEAEKAEEYNYFIDEDNAVVDIWLNGTKLKNTAIYDKYRKYADFIQAQMSTDEMALVFYNGLMFPKMKTLINYYDLLENLPNDYLVNKSDAKFYD